MFISFMLAFFLGLNVCLEAAEVPRTFHYQGRFLDRDTNRPVEGVVNKQIRFNIRRVNADQTLGSIIRGVTKQVSVIDGVFSSDLDFSDLPFDEPYAVQVIVQGSGGGDVGTQKLRTVPYSFTSRDALQLGGITSAGYAKKSHSHETSGTKSFTIDGSGASLGVNDTQFEVISGATNAQGSSVFRVNASGDLDQVGSVKVKNNIEISGRLVVRNELGIEVIVGESSSGNLKIAGNLDVAQNSIVGSLIVSNAATLQQVNIMGDLTFGPDARINFPADGGRSIIGESHALEHHQSSQLLTDIQALVSNGAALSSTNFHTHSFVASSISSDTIADNAVLSKHITDGTIVNADISDTAAIADSKLAQIVSPSKITTSALCDANGVCPVPFKGQSNVFGAGFSSDSAKGRVDTINYFDAMQSKQMTVISTNSLTRGFVSFSDAGNLFKWDIDGDGTLTHRMKVGLVYQDRIKIAPSGVNTKISLNNVVFEGNAQMITGAIITDGSITTNDLANNAITTAKIANGAISTAKIAASAITLAKVAADAIDSSKIKDGSIDSSDILAGAVTTVKIQDASITSALIATNAIDTTNIKDGAITATKISNSSITTAQIADGTIQTSDIGDLQVTAAKIKDGEIKTSHLVSSVVKSRTEAMSISINDSTTSPNLTLSRQNAGTFLRMIDQTTNTQTTPALLFEDNGSTPALKKSVSLNLDGSISLKSDSYLTPVTLTPNMFAVMFGKSKSIGDTCPFGNGYSLVAPGSSKDVGGGFCAKKYDGGNVKDYKGAMVQCSGEGARICSTNEMLKACAANVYNTDVTDYMTSDLVENAGLRYGTIQLVGASTCAASANFTLANALVGTNNEFFCCINP